MPFSNSPILSYGALIIGLVPLSIGLGALFYDPYTLVDFSGYPRPSSSTSTDAQTLEAFLYFFGLRDLTFGSITLAVWQNGDRKMLGTVIILGMCMAFGDGVVNRMHVQGSEWNHWPLVPVGMGIGLGLRGWFDGIL